MNITNKCHICNATEVDAKPIITAEQQKNLLNSIYKGIVTSHTLPLDLYLLFCEAYKDALFEGVGLTDKTNIKDVPTLEPKIVNTQVFAAAKLYQMVREAESYRLNTKGQLVKPLTFIKNTETILGDFLGAYMFAEKDHATSVGRATTNWNKRDTKTADPYGEYVTKKDNRVRPAHAVLDGIIRKISDKFWGIFYPPNGWLCRCLVKIYAKGVNTDLQDFDMEEALANVPPQFRYNFGKEDFVYPKNHPYFKVPKKDRDFARKNFNLPFPHGN